MSLTLYYHPLSSFCWKVLIALYENDISFTPRLINLGDADDRAAFLKLWPIGKFPVLRDEQSQRTIPESSIIIEYLDQHFAGVMRFIPAAPDLALRTRLRDRFLDLYLHMPTQTIVFDRLRPSDTRDPLGVADARARLRTSYAMLEAELPSAGWTSAECQGCSLPLQPARRPPRPSNAAAPSAGAARRMRKRGEADFTP